MADAQTTLLEVAATAPSTRRTTSKGIGPGDIVEIDKRGRRFHALVTELAAARDRPLRARRSARWTRGSPTAPPRCARSSTSGAAPGARPDASFGAMSDDDHADRLPGASERRPDRHDRRRHDRHRRQGARQRARAHLRRHRRQDRHRAAASSTRPRSPAISLRQVKLTIDFAAAAALPEYREPWPRRRRTAASFSA